MIVNNYYIGDKEKGWKQLMEGEIPPNISENMTRRISSEISPKTGVNTEERSLNTDQEVKTTTKPMKSTQEIVEQKRYQSEEAEAQIMSAPQHTILIIHPL